MAKYERFLTCMCSKGSIVHSGSKLSISGKKKSCNGFPVKYRQIWTKNLKKKSMKSKKYQAISNCLDVAFSINRKWLPYSSLENCFSMSVWAISKHLNPRFPLSTSD